MNAMSNEVDVVEMLRERLGGVSCDLMQGDNLAITLCSHFDDGEESEDDHCWSPAAIAGCDQTLDAIHAYYAAEITKLRAEKEDLLRAAEHFRAERDAAAREMRERCFVAAQLAFEQSIPQYALVGPSGMAMAMCNAICALPDTPGDPQP